MSAINMSAINMTSMKTNALGDFDKLKIPDAAAKGNFADHLHQALGQVAQMEKQADTITQAFESGEEADVTKVMMAREKSAMAFEATLQVRNKLLSAYKDIMSMPI